MEKNYTPIINQYIKIKEKHKDKILFFRMGDFYELFFEDAIECSKLLMLNLTSRNKKDKNPISMCGFPYYVANHYISKLMQYGKQVVMCEQTGGEKTSGLMNRQITQIITPGTFVSEHSTDDINNYITCIYLENNTYGISNIDLCNGYFSIKELIDKTELEDELDKIKPNEILISENIDNLSPEKTTSLIQKVSLNLFNYTESIKFIQTILLQDVIKNKYFLQFKNAIMSAGYLLKYIYNNQNKKLKNINHIDIYNPTNILKVDKQTRKNLEIFISNTGDKKNSLFNTLDLTCTLMGRRLLKKWFDYPMVSTNNAIQDRLNAVTCLKKNYYHIEIIRQALKEIDDIEKIIYNITRLTVKSTDLKKLQTALTNFNTVKKIIINFKKNKLLKNISLSIDSFEYIINLIKKGIHNETNTIHTTLLIKNGFDKKLDCYRKKLHTLNNIIFKYQTIERKKTNIKSLKIIQSKAGYCIEIPKKYKIPHEYIEIKKLSNNVRYLNPKIKKIEYLFSKIKNKLVKREKKLYNYICYKINKNILKIQRACKNIAILDILQSFAKISSLYSWTKPKIVHHKIIKINAGRHPVIDIKNNLTFTPNNTTLDKHNLIYIITGANMSGKSTYMRQVAILTFLAHIGSHIPAKYAQIGGIDKIFTRLGANDDITNSLSTFMLEMTEMSYIINNATSNSLIIIDEVGRGTNYLEGKAIALSLLSYLIIKIKPFVLFSTHFYDIALISKLYNHVNKIYFKTILDSDKLHFIYKYYKGYTNKGFAIYVTKKTGMPETIINMSTYYLKNLTDHKPIQPTSQNKHKSIKKLNSLLLKKLNNITHIIKKFIK